MLKKNMLWKKKEKEVVFGGGEISGKQEWEEE